MEYYDQFLFLIDALSFKDIEFKEETNLKQNVYYIVLRFCPPILMVK